MQAKTDSSSPRPAALTAPPRTFLLCLKKQNRGEHSLASDLAPHPPVAADLSERGDLVPREWKSFRNGPSVLADLIDIGVA